MFIFNLALKIQCSSSINAELLRQEQGFVLQKRGEIDVKGKGKQVTYWLLKRNGGNSKSTTLHQSSRFDILLLEEQVT